MAILSKNIRNLVSDSVIYGFGTIVTRFIGIFILPLFTKLINPTDYGIYSLILMSNLIATNLFSFGQTASVGTIYFRNSKIDSSEAFWGATLISFLGTITLAFLALVFPLELCELFHVPSSHADLLTTSLLGVSINILGSIFLQYLQLEQKANLYVILTSFAAIIAVCLSFFYVVYMGKGIYGLILASIFSGIFLLVSSVFYVLLDKKFSFSYTITRELLLTGISFIPSNLIWFALVNNNRYILESYYGLGAIGIYSVGYSIGNSLSVLTSGIASAWFPFFMKYVDNQQEAKELFQKITYYYIIGVGALTLILFSMSSTISLFLLDERYYMAYKVIGFVGTASFLTGIFNLLLPGVYYANEVRKLWVIQLIAMLISIPFSFLCIFYFGILGAGISLSLSHFFVPICLYIWLLLSKVIKFKVVFDWKRLSIYFLFFVCLQFLFLITASEDLVMSITTGILGTLIVIIFTIQFLLDSDLDKVGFLKKIKFI